MEKKIQEIAASIRNKADALGRKGVVVGLSGGLDSSVVAALCVEGVGNRRVTGLTLPEREGNPDAARYAGEIAAHLGIGLKTKDITRALAGLGVYANVLSRVPTRRLKAVAVRKYLAGKDGNAFLEFLKGGGDAVLRKGIANLYSKARIRTVFLFAYAEEHSLLFADSCNRSEYALGLFPKGDGADVTPLKDLYRTEVLELARCLKLPEGIISRPADTDMIPGFPDKYLDIFGIPSERMDIVLRGFQQGVPPGETARRAGVSEEQVREIGEVIRLTEHMRIPDADAG